MVTAQSYGEHLPDQVERIASLSQAQLDLVADIRELYRERAVLEREHAVKLQALGHKALAKKVKSMTKLVVGEDPTKGYNDATLAASTIDAAYSQVVSFVSDTASHHIKLADSLNAQVVEAFRSLESKHDGARKKQLAFFQKLLNDRDKVYSDRNKNKSKYDEECGEVETYRHKQGKASDDKHAERAAKQFEQQEIDMNNAKNVYLVAIAASNATKSKFYSTDLPVLENQLQRLQASLLGTLAAILLQATAIEGSSLTALQTRLQYVTNAASAIDARKDQDVFIDLNIRPFTMPSDFVFEPCGVHYDTPDMSVAPAAKVFLQNKLGKSKTKLRELDAIIDSKRGEVESLSIQLEATGTDPSSLRDNTLEAYLDASHELTSFESSQTILRAEVDSILAALDGDEGSQNPHQFKSSSFSIPTTCGYCKTSIWGLSKQGKTCKQCGLSVHGKCELKVPADCGGARGKHGNTGSVSEGGSTLKHRPSTSTVSSISDVTPTPSSFVDSQSYSSFHDRPTARMMYAYAATSPFELSVSEGAAVTIMEEDDGSGWIKVDDGAGGKGLVPASYVDTSADGPATPTAVTSPLKNGSGVYVRGLYEYAAQGPDEMAVAVGQLIELSDGPNGGQNYASGWWEGVSSSGKKGIFPSNYVELA